MTTEDFIIGLFCRIDDQMKNIAKALSSEPLSQRNRHSWQFCLPSKGLVIAPFIVGLFAIGAVFFPNCRKGPGCFACSKPIPIGHSYFLAETYRPRRC